MDGYAKSSKTIKTFKTLGKAHRIEILALIERGPKRIYSVYKLLKEENPKLYVSLIERSLMELSSNGLVYRDGEKQYQITSYGSYILNSLVNGIDPEVVSYLKTHKTDLPENLLRGFFGSLRNAIIIKEIAVADTFFRTQQQMKKDVLFLLDMPLLSQKTSENNLKMLERGIKIRCILNKENFKAHFDKKQMGKFFDDKALDFQTNVFILNKTDYDIQTRFLPSVKVNVYIADKKLIFMNLPELDGSFNFHLGIVSEEPELIEWGLRVFDYYWGKADGKHE